MQKTHPPRLLGWHRLRLAAGRTVTWGARWRRLHCGCGGGVHGMYQAPPTHSLPDSRPMAATSLPKPAACFCPRPQPPPSLPPCSPHAAFQMPQTDASHVRLTTMAPSCFSLSACSRHPLLRSRREHHPLPHVTIKQYIFYKFAGPTEARSLPTAPRHPGYPWTSTLVQASALHSYALCHTTLGCTLMYCLSPGGQGTYTCTYIRVLHSTA
ncbi:hypothetical protein COCC4DRAFT_124714 [Bipolaris maydis ATCC 48331]|uniref:Uncharacterized protein n=2 Tax=Cochliobolus heterostrophus TaxID=5016 RepID=M2U8F9_COCH5|nr:uncharacterized protein COCC4DRAFT_124714 [Bipolaris maydis ATCC 48331]EMD90056.1 hypothetical protein COCHEDRAFT_1031415 [Bipolaris maydis C5]ENI09730.1 hypothetical protein COCC4DRAFT_124714 [Bipolaris maydis ATCC 48331]KAJ6207877.1 hypothetical protein PSV09DRAFT_1031415 [Bipolaris maydis]